jgi:hypothetical protein
MGARRPLRPRRGGRPCRSSSRDCSPWSTWQEFPATNEGSLLCSGSASWRFAAGFRWLPWRRWPARTTLVVVPVAMAMALLFRRGTPWRSHRPPARPDVPATPGVPTAGGGGYQEAVGRLGAPTAVGPDGGPPVAEGGCPQPACADCCRGCHCQRSGDLGSGFDYVRTRSGTQVLREVSTTEGGRCWRYVRQPETTKPVRCTRPTVWIGRHRDGDGHRHTMRSCDGHPWRLESTRALSSRAGGERNESGSRTCHVPLCGRSRRPRVPPAGDSYTPRPPPVTAGLGLNPRCLPATSGNSYRRLARRAAGRGQLLHWEFALERRYLPPSLPPDAALAVPVPLPASRTRRRLNGDSKKLAAGEAYSAVATRVRRR